MLEFRMRVLEEELPLLEREDCTSETSGRKVKDEERSAGCSRCNTHGGRRGLNGIDRTTRD